MRCGIHHATSRWWFVVLAAIILASKQRCWPRPAGVATGDVGFHFQHDRPSWISTHDKGANTFRMLLGTWPAFCAEDEKSEVVHRLRVVFLIRGEP